MFCKKCAEEMGGFEPELTIKNLKMKPGQYCSDLCEGCGRIYLENNHGKESVYRSDYYWKGVIKQERQRFVNDLISIIEKYMTGILKRHHLYDLKKKWEEKS